MELIIKNMALPDAIEFNFDEIKKELSEKVSEYTNLVYTDDKVNEAKKDIAELRKFSKALSEQRISAKKEYLKPFEDFENKVKELEKIVGEPIALIDKQIKDYAEAVKADKKEKIAEIFKTTNPPEWLTLEKIFDEKWLNVSSSLKSITEAIECIVDRVNIDIATLSSLPEFGFEATEIYKSTLDFNKAISEGHRLAEIQKRKLEDEARKAEETNRVEAVETVENSTDVDEAPEEIEEGFIPSFNDNQEMWYIYHLQMTNNQKTILEQFLINSGIKYISE